MCQAGKSSQIKNIFPLTSFDDLFNFLYSVRPRTWKLEMKKTTWEDYFNLLYLVAWQKYTLQMFGVVTIEKLTQQSFAENLLLDYN